MKKHISPSYYAEARRKLFAIKENLDKQVILIERMRQHWREWAEEKQRLDARDGVTDKKS